MGGDRRSFSFLQAKNIHKRETFLKQDNTERKRQKFVSRNSYYRHERLRLMWCTVRSQRW